MDKVLTRKLFKDAYLKSLGMDVSNYNKGGLASLKIQHFYEGGLTEAQRDLVVTSPFISALLQGTQQPGQSQAGAIATALAKGYAQVPEAYKTLAAIDEVDLKAQEIGVKAKNQLQTQMQEIAKDYRNIYRQSSIVKDFETSQTQLNKLIDARSQKTAAGDLGMIFTYMKVLDPGSTVREGEQATAENAKGIPDYIKNAYNKAMTGQKLPESQREEFQKAAIGLFQSNQESLDKFRVGIHESAAPKGIDAHKDVFFDNDVRPKQIQDDKGNVINVPVGTKLVDVQVNEKGTGPREKYYVFKMPNGVMFKQKVD
jgi:hypothetical protein